MRRISLILILFFISFGTYAQEQNSIWMHGNNVGLDFTTYPITTFYSPHSFISSPYWSDSDNNPSSAVCDTAGNLLFSVNRNTILDRYNDTMPNGRNLMGHAYGSFQATMIIPYPNSCNKYIVFKTNSHENNFSFCNQNLSYSVVDMCLNNGLGDVVVGQKNILLSDSCLSPMIAIPHANKRDIWLIAHTSMGSINNYESYLVTPNGVNPNPVISNFPVDSNMLWWMNIGYNQINSSFSDFFIRASSNGNLIASNFGTPEPQGNYLGSTGGASDVLKLYNFDRNTGQLSLNIDITQHLNCYLQIWAFEFSPNDNYLYMAVYFDRTQWPNWSSTNADLYYLLQYDIINQTWTDVDTLDAHRIYDMRLGPDNKIYTCKGSNPLYMGTIHNPDLPGRLCNFVYNDIPLYTGTSIFKYFPNHFKGWDELTAPRTFLPEDTILCMGEQLVTNVSNTVNDCNISNYFWHDNSQDSIKTFNQAGTYWLEVHDMCGIDRDTLELEVRDLSFSLGNDTTLCEENSFKLYADSSMATVFLWNDNTNLRTLNVNSNGVYWCEISDSICAFRDSIYVCFFDFPTVFLGNDTTICMGDSLVLGVYDPNITASLWNNGSTSNSISISDSGLYSVTLWNNICQITDSIQIAIAELPDINWAPNDTFFCFNQSLDLYFPNDNSLYFTWNGNPAYSPVTVYNAGVYVLTVSDQYCTAETEIEINAEDCSHIYIPNVITPNGDGFNDVLEIIDIQNYKNNSISIYNRWGTRVFHESPYQGDWAPNNKGAGPFYYVLELKDEGSVINTYKGTIDIVVE